MDAGIANKKSAVNKKGITLIIAILLIAFLDASNGATTPALASIGKAFPTVDNNTLILISTLPQLLIVPFSIISGKLAGNKVKYRTLALIGILTISVAGVIPYFLDNFYAILAARVFIGVGIGISAPLANTYILNLFEGKKMQNLMGLSRVSSSAGAMTFQMIGGILCAVSWKNTFLVYLIGIIGLVFLFFKLPEPPKVKKQDAELEIGKIKEKGGGINATALIWILLYAFMTFFTYPFYLNMSSLVANGNLGTAATSGFILTTSSFAGMLGSLLFGTVFRFLKRKIIPIGFVFCTITYAIMIFCNSAVAFTIASFCTGFGFGLIVPAINMYAGLAVSPSSRAFAMSLMFALPNLAMFFTSYFFSFIKTAFGITYDRYIFVIGIVFYIICGIVFAFAKIEPKASNVEEEKMLIPKKETVIGGE